MSGGHRLPETGERWVDDVGREKLEGEGQEDLDQNQSTSPVPIHGPPA